MGVTGLVAVATSVAEPVETAVAVGAAAAGNVDLAKH